MNIPKNLKYTKSHEWILMNEDSTASIGLTDYAQDALEIWSSSTCRNRRTS